MVWRNEEPGRRRELLNYMAILQAQCHSLLLAILASFQFTCRCCVRESHKVHSLAYTRLNPYTGHCSSMSEHES
jgi:hypothetical protein